MNIFFTSDCPVECAKFLDNKRVVKMVLESAQLLSGAIQYNTSEYINIVYKKTHINHPCAIWVRTSQANYRWLYKHFIALLNEYNLRYKKTHACYKYVPIFDEALTYIPKGQLTEKPNCTPFKQLDLYTAYRSHLVNKWLNDKTKVKWNV